MWPLVAIILGVTDLLLIFPIAGWLGWGPTQLWVLTAAVVGFLLLRACRRALGRVPRNGDLGRQGLEALGRAATLGVSGLLFLLPGILSDIAALLFLVPPLRRSILRSFFRRASIDIYESMTYGASRGRERAHTDSAGGEGATRDYGGQVRDVEFEVLDDSGSPGRRPPDHPGQSS